MLLNALNYNLLCFILIIMYLCGLMRILKCMCCNLVLKDRMISDMEVEMREMNVNGVW